MCIGSLAFLEPLERRTVLPSMATTPSGTPVSDATRPKTALQLFGIAAIAQVIMRWHAFTKGRNRRKRSRFLSPKRAMSVMASARAITATRHSSSTSSNGYLTFALCRPSGRFLK